MQTPQYRSAIMLSYGFQPFLTFMVVNAKHIMKLLTGITLRKLAKGRHSEPSVRR